MGGTQDHADSSNNLDIKICQDQKCCNTGTLIGNFDKGSKKQFQGKKIGDCFLFELNSNEDIDVTFNQLNSDGWRGELLTIITVQDMATWTYGCPVTTWLDVNSQEDHGEDNGGGLFSIISRYLLIFPKP